MVVLHRSRMQTYLFVAYAPERYLLLLPNLPDMPGASLQSSETRGLLDVVDNLRSQGISRYIDLPEIIVCGEQSSGKSSVLEAISGVTFPSKDNLCTRFATELVLRKGEATDVKIRIVPGSTEERSESEKERLLQYNVSSKLNDLNLEEIIESAKELMGINDSGKVFSSDILRLEVSGPDQPHLTLVDLPGLFQAGSRSQTDADSDSVKSLVLSYMQRPRSIILAVVSAKNDFNNQSITRYAREIDPKGMRTLGLITKPDTLDEGSDSERFYIELAQNKEVNFRLGWHVLRNRDYNTRNCSLQERNRLEEQFFSKGVWATLLSTQVGVHSLKPRLSKILKEQIVAQLPAVIAQIQDGLQDCSRRLEILGESRSSIAEQRRYLLRVSQQFTNLIKDACDGRYSNSFFGDAATEEGHQRRLRAAIQNTLMDYAEKMRTRGSTYVIVDDDQEERERMISRKDYVAKVNKLLQRSRGRELPGTFDPLVIGELFREQRQSWEELTTFYVDKVIQSVHNVIRAVLLHVSDMSTMNGLLEYFIFPRLEELIADLKEKVGEVLRPYDVGHPITYNHYLTENVQKAQHGRRTKEIKRSLQEFLGAHPTDEGDVTANLNIANLTQLMVSKTEADMNNYASSTATDFMEAYYKVALKKAVDNISILAIEARLIEKLPTLLNPETVLEIGDETVVGLAAEDEESMTERRRCVEKKGILEEGLKMLKSQQHHFVNYERTIPSKAPCVSNGNPSESPPEELPVDVPMEEPAEPDYEGGPLAEVDEAPDEEKDPPAVDNWLHFQNVPSAEPIHRSKKSKKGR
ncbi:hypothetical protein BU24DRAFT_440087 [Aaosphaeria arxii CBS 175.79]|uniref:P-loop containing nucleoside triphosphate hydrolase protein n=1 Tax=Aaosphaeria arxii CBS 175.79 TaxID=1450172 RepID=A0A6A5XX99_9PLEO|nr:uncharacterized protein BU24DRAFT_440087 [Aaosphaeria arxii CBS 175.79]KAF2016894.1 hypothetical protein BU24DRAFT_440087 [Aaosphaeria arxii CBS 175.79]